MRVIVLGRWNRDDLTLGCMGEQSGACGVGQMWGRLFHPECRVLRPCWLMLCWDPQCLAEAYSIRSQTLYGECFDGASDRVQRVRAFFMCVDIGVFKCVVLKQRRRAYCVSGRFREAFELCSIGAPGDSMLKFRNVLPCICKTNSFCFFCFMKNSTN